MGNGVPVVLGTDGAILTVSGDNYIIYSLDTGQAISTAIPPYNADVTPYLPARSKYRVVWSEYLKSAVVVGGPPIERTLPTNQWVSLYHPGTDKWTLMETFGLKLDGIEEHCIAITDDGKRLLSYGGIITKMPNSPVKSDLFMLNLETGEWFECANSNLTRSGATCTISGDYFILWGGTAEQDGVVEVVGANVGAGRRNPMAIFQISKNSWVDEYQPFTEYRDPFPSSPRPPSASPPQGSNNTSNEIQDLREEPINVGYIAGAVAGALAVVAIVGFLVWRRKRQTKNQSRQQDDTTSGSSHHMYVLEDKNNLYNGTKRSPQSHVQLTSPRSLQPSDDAFYEDGDQDEHWGIPKRSGYDPITRGTPRAKSMSGKTPAHSPLSDSWNVCSNGGHTEDRLWANPTASSARTQLDSSRTHMSPRLRDMFVSPPPPSLSPLSDPPLISRLRSPQELENRPVWKETLDQSQGGDGKWTEERPGPQWLPR
ncbi:hypothetical protein BGW42_005975 [Actinomortierella wolfii]|nr:hypothetical protein BGW42_005975 [Actinomortierella wolfii]